MPPKTPLFDWSVFTPSTLIERGKGQSPADKAAWHARGRYGIHERWAKLVKNPEAGFHPVWYDLRYQRGNIRFPAEHDLLKDVLDVVSPSTLVVAVLVC